MPSKHLAAEMGPRGIRVRPRQSSLPASDVSLPPAGPVVAPTVPATPPARMASRPAVPGRVPPVSAPRNAEEDVRYGLRVAAGYAWRFIVVIGAVYGVFIFLGRIKVVGVALFIGL